MAFILPVAVAERVGTITRLTVGLLPSPRRRVVVGLVCLAVVTHSALTGSPEVALISTVSAGLAVATTSWWWRRDGRHRQWDLRTLPPSDRQGKWLALILVLQYVIFIPASTPEKMSSRVGHRCGVIALYRPCAAAPLRPTAFSTDPSCTSAPLSLDRTSTGSV